MKSVMEHSFSQVPRADVPRSSFDRSHGHKLTFDADYLIPILVDEVLPGDTYNLNTSMFARLASPTLFPLLDNLYVDLFYFYVPYRLVWENWDRFLGVRRPDPDTTIDLTIPVTSSSSTVAVGDVADYMGIPTGLDLSARPVNALPFRALRLIWNEWFRDQNLQDSLSVPVDDGPDGNSETAYYDAPPKRNKKHDYFTSALPWPQKGDAVELPLGTVARVATDALDNVDVVVYDTAGATWNKLDASDAYLDKSSVEGTSTDYLYADLSNATAATINELRLAFQTQRLLERDARSGTRINELILAHYGVTVPDFRVQRPEFLGGSTHAVNITPVAQTTYQGTETINDAKGALAGIGTVQGQSGFTKSFVEHGLIIGLANARSDITYSQGIERFWNRSTRYDFFWPVLSQIGEQTILNQEIWADESANDLLTFGYQERYAEYRYKPSKLSALMRVDPTSTLSAWHLSEDFATLPTLGSTFIESNTGTPLDRAISVPTEPHFIADFYFNLRCARPMPLYGVPGNLDHL